MKSFTSATHTHTHTHTHKQTNNSREIKSRGAMTKAEFNKKATIFTRILDLNIRKKLINSTFGA
jgi:hypothetical protein